MTERKLAQIKQIDEIFPIDGADFVVCARVGGWHAVVKKDQYKVGDHILYIETDAWIPHQLAPFLTREGDEPKVWLGIPGQRLKTRKIRGQISQGLILDIQDADWFEIEDLDTHLGINKWERVRMDGQTQGGDFPSFLRSTGLPRVQNLTHRLWDEKNSDKVFTVMTKLDGESCTNYIYNGQVGVTSRRVDLDRSDDNRFWNQSNTQNIPDAFEAAWKDGRIGNIALQFELMGPGCQSNRDNLPTRQLFAYGGFDIDNQKSLTVADAQALVELLNSYGANIQFVPIQTTEFKLSQFKNDLNGLLKFAEGRSLNTKRREGIVIRENKTDGFVFKVLSNKYLLAHDE